MAFDLRRLENAGLHGRGTQFWTYKTDDSISTVDTDNYFLFAWTKLRIGDHILVSVFSGLETASEAFTVDTLLAVTSVSRTSLTTRLALQSSTGVFNVLSYGAVGNGTTDDTAAIQAAITAAGSNSTVLFPDTGSSYRTGPLLVSAQSGVTLQGTGRRGAQLLFVSAGNQSDTVGASTDPGTCIQFACNSGLTQQSQCAIFNMSISATSSVVHDKNGVRVVNNSQFSMNKVTINTFYGGPNGSCALRTMGHELMSVSECSFAASIPIRISLDPAAGSSFISCDSFHFSDLYLLGPLANGGATASAVAAGLAGGPALNANSLWPDGCLVIDDGVRINNLLFDGNQAWVGNAEGIYWVSPTSPGDTQWSIAFKNIRKEQGYGANRKLFRINLNATYPLQTVIFENCASGEDATFFYARNVENINIIGGVRIATSTSVAAGNYVVDCNVANTVKSMTWTGVRVHILDANLKDAGLVANSSPARTGWTLPFTGTWTV